MSTNRAQIVLIALIITVVVLGVSHWLMTERISNGVVLVIILFVSFLLMVRIVDKNEKARREDRIKEKRQLDSHRFSDNEW